MKSQTAVVLGASGLIGSQLVELLLADDAFVKVRVLVRKQLTIKNEKLDVELVNFDDLSDFKNKLGKGDCIFCCVGTTQKKVSGDKQAYRKVDFDIAVNAAKFGAEAGFTKFLLVSSVGANAKATNFYLQLKGEVEKAVSLINFRSVHIFQPSMLLGKRNEFRFGESLGKGIMKALSFMFVGGLNKYKGIDARDVAKSMIAASKKENAGVVVYQYKEMMHLIKQDLHQV